MTIHGSMPSRSKWVVPLIWKLCPFIEDKPSFSQTALHLARNQVHFIGAHWPSANSNVKSGAVSGMDVFDERWCSRADVALHEHVESVMLTSSPFSFVFMHGMWKFTYLRPLVAIPCLIWVDQETWEVGSKQESIKSSPTLNHVSNSKKDEQ